MSFARYLVVVISSDSDTSPSFILFLVLLLLLRVLCFSVTIPCDLSMTMNELAGGTYYITIKLMRGCPVRLYRCRVADEPGPWVPRHHPVHPVPHPRLDPRAAGCSMWVSLRTPYARSATARLG